MTHELASRKCDLTGWGRLAYQSSRVWEPETTDDLRRCVESADTSLIARGCGRAYGDAAMNGGGAVIETSGLDGIRSFDRDAGRIVVDSGVSIAELLPRLHAAGWSLPVVPGTQHVSIGGAIAADIHGKNHHVDGSFGRYVSRMRVLIADGTELECTPNVEPELFFATLGGMGLTGIILDAELQLESVDCTDVDVSFVRTRALDTALELIRASERDYRYSVAWLDCVPGRGFGRAIVMRGNPAVRREGPTELPSNAPRSRSLPRWSRVLLNRWTVKTFNTLYYARHTPGTRRVDFQSFFFPLDRIANWPVLYGSGGFTQVQVLFPPESAAAGLRAFLGRVARDQDGGYLGVLKSTGEASGGYLSFPRPGFTLAVDLPATERLEELARELETVALEYDGSFYLAKDAFCSREGVRRMYPHFESFTETKRRFDPGNRFSSSLSRRLGLGG